MKLLIDMPKEKYEWIKAHNLNIDNDSIVGAVANGTPYDEIIEKVTDLIETEWGYEGIKEDVARIMLCEV